jgi:hypothetical protein
MSIERVPFRLIQMPCCNMLYCAVNPRLPNYCIECGERVYAKIKNNPSCILILDENATLKYKESK